MEMFTTFFCRSSGHFSTIFRNCGLLSSVVRRRSSGGVSLIQELSLGGCLQRLKTLFHSAGVSEPVESAEYIVARAVNRKTLSGVDLDTQLTQDVTDHIASMVDKRLQHMPVQYVIGEWDFRSLVFDLRPPVFIPRPETEELIEKALLDPIVYGASQFIEVGCGSGAICVSLLKELPFVKCIAVDCSHEACELTRHNSLKNHVADRLKIVNETWTYEFSQKLRHEHGASDFLISNPPYVETGEMDSLAPEISRYEDRAAFDGGVDGLNIIRTILQTAHFVVRSGASVWLEVGLSHAQKIQQLILCDRVSYYVNCTGIYSDFTNRERFCKFKVL